MAKYKAYPEYKDSGIEWIGNIPSHWEVASLSKLFSIKAGGDVQQSLFSEVCSDDYPYPIYTNANDKFAVYGYTKKANYRSNTITVSGRGDIGFAVYRNHAYDAIIRLLVLAPLKQVECKFYSYFINSVIDFKVESSAIGQLSTQQISPYKSVIPSRVEQRIITIFLDHETAKIDNLIEKQQQLIELLKEKRQAVISHAVTKGLNPDVPMKDSGVEWLGDVPEHWDIKPLRYLGECQNGINIGAEAFGSGFPFVSYGDAYKNRVLTDSGSGLVQSTAEDRRKYSLLRGDVLFTRTSETIEEIGFASACVKSIENACFAGFLIRFRPKSSELCIEYSKYYFSNQLLRIFFTKEMNLITRASLSQDLLKTMPVVIPPVDEQVKISELLDNISEKFDQLQLLGEEQIKYLQERRTALISAAVTGKIDVRDWVAPDTQDVEEPQEATA